MQQTYNCIIIDDNPIDIKIMQVHLSKLPHLTIIDTFNNPIDAIPTIHSGEIDIMFLDIEMPEMTGIGLLDSLEKIPQTILISNHVGYSMDAFEIGVTDYIQKPVSFERLLKSVSRAVENIHLQDKTLKELVVPKENFIFLKSGRESLKFNLDDILYVEALASFTKVFTDGKTTVISESISDLHLKFPLDTFLRVHKSYLVPLNKIIGISTKAVILENHKIPLGLSYRESIEKILEGTEGLQD
jgi:DNA-binding LytR/AlgR family response regulator